MWSAIGYALLVLDVWALYDIMRRPLAQGTKLGWVALVILLPYFGLLLYLLVGRSSLREQERAGHSHS